MARTKDIPQLSVGPWYSHPATVMTRPPESSPCDHQYGPQCLYRTADTPPSPAVHLLRARGTLQCDICPCRSEPAPLKQSAGTEPGDPVPAATALRHLQNQLPVNRRGRLRTHSHSACPPAPCWPLVLLPKDPHVSCLGRYCPRLPPALC